MIKFLKELYKDYHTSQQEMSKMGIWQFPSIDGIWTYIDQETFREYLKKKEQDNERD